MTQALEAAPPETGYRILLANGDDENLDPVERLLADENHVCARRASGAAGLAAALENRPDLILIGSHLPDMGCLELCQQLRRQPSLRNTPLIVLLDSHRVEERLAVYAAGGDDYVTQPFEAKEVAARIAATIRRQRSLDAIREQAGATLKTANGLMDSLGETSLIIHFLQSVSTSKHPDGLAHHIVQTHSALGLDISIELRVGDETHHYCTGGIVHPLEKSVFTYIASKGRLVDFNERTVVNFPRISILVRNMPIHDQARYGRIRDYIAIIGQAADDKIGDIESELALRAQYLDLLDIGEQTRQAITELQQRQHDFARDSQRIVAALAEGLDESIVTLGLSEAQEDYLVSEIGNAHDELQRLANHGAALDGDVERVLRRLSETLAGLAPPEPVESGAPGDNEEAVTFF